MKINQKLYIMGGSLFVVNIICKWGEEKLEIMENKSWNTI